MRSRIRWIWEHGTDSAPYLVKRELVEGEPSIRVTKYVTDEEIKRAFEEHDTRGSGDNSGEIER